MANEVKWKSKKKKKTSRCAERAAAAVAVNLFGIQLTNGSAWRGCSRHTVGPGIQSRWLYFTAISMKVKNKSHLCTDSFYSVGFTPFTRKEDRSFTGSQQQHRKQGCDCCCTRFQTVDTTQPLNQPLHIKLTWTAGVPWSCGSWRRTSLSTSLSCGSTPVRPQLCGGRTLAGPAAAGSGTRTVAPGIWTAPPVGYGSLSIERDERNERYEMIFITHSHNFCRIYKVCVGRQWDIFIHPSIHPLQRKHTKSQKSCAGGEPGPC